MHIPGSALTRPGGLLCTGHPLRVCDGARAGPVRPAVPAPKDAQAGGRGVGPRPLLKGKRGREETH